MIALAAAIKDHWHAVERDLLALGLHADDIGTPKLSTCELISIVVAAHPGTALHHFDPMAWSKEAELLANLGEQRAGLLQLSARYARPQVDSSYVPSVQVGTAPAFGVTFDTLPNDQFMVKLRERQARARREAEEQQ